MEPVTRKENRLSQNFHGYELLLLRRLQNDPVLYKEWSKKLRNRIADKDYDLALGVRNTKIMLSQFPVQSQTQPGSASAPGAGPGPDPGLGDGCVTGQNGDKQNGDTSKRRQLQS